MEEQIFRKLSIFQNILQKARSLLKIVRNISEQFQKHLEHFYEVRNSGVTKSSYETEFRKITSHFELLTRTFLQKFFFRAKVELT